MNGRAILWCLIAVLTAVPVASAEDRCTTPVPANHCMIGTWQADSTDAPEQYNSAGGPSRWVDQDMGDNEFVFRADGTFSQKTERASSRFQHRVGAGQLDQEVTITSTSTGRWSPSEAGLLLCKETFEMKMGVGANATPLPQAASAAETQGEIPYEVSCEGDRATVTLLMPGAPRISWAVRRVDP